MKIPGGFFITLEGIEGCGKTTQARLLAERLTGIGYNVTHTREPGGTTIGGRIRAVLLDPESKGMDPMAELMLYSADRAQHVRETIEPALNEGGVVICDRYTDATLAYQGFGRGLDVEVIDTLTELCTGGCAPDLTLLLDLPVEAGLSRAVGRNEQNGMEKEARFEREAVSFHERVRAGYLNIACLEPGRVKVIPAAGDIDDVQEAIRDEVDKALGNR